MKSLVPALLATCAACSSADSPALDAGPGRDAARVDAADPPGDAPPAIDAAVTVPHTITLDGIDDFRADEQFATTSAPSFVARVTWDANNLYVGYGGPDLATTAPDAGTKWLLVHVDTDPGAATGAASAETYNSQAASFPAGFGAEHYARWKVDGTLASLRSYSTGSWGDAAATLGAAQQQTFVELAIPRTLLGASTTLGVVTFMINEKALAEGTYAGLYAGSFTDGYSPAMPVTRYLRLDLAVPEPPNAATHEITP